MLGRDEWRRDPIRTTLFVGQVGKKSNQSESFEVRLIFEKTAANAGACIAVKQLNKRSYTREQERTN